ncbi:hypothetical protein ACFLU6_15045 [Acidobacteriota bacterium]
MTGSSRLEKHKALWKVPRLPCDVDIPWADAKLPPTACPQPTWTSLQLAHCRLENRYAVYHTYHRAPPLQFTFLTEKEEI